MVLRTATPRITMAPKETIPESTRAREAGSGIAETPVIWLVSSVAAPLRAKTRTLRLAPVFSVSPAEAMIVPANEAPITERGGTADLEPQVVGGGTVDNVKGNRAGRNERRADLEDDERIGFVRRA